MYETFVLRTVQEGKIQGYSWELQDPRKVVVIVHGIGEYGGRFDRVAEAFRKEGLAVLALDLRGHGASLGKKGHCAPRSEVLEDVTALLEYAAERYPGKTLILYGHSMGGNIALDYRSRGSRSDLPAGYIISAPWIRLVRPVPKPLYGAVKLIAKIAPAFTISSDVNEDHLGHPESVRPYKENPMVHNRISALCAVEGFEIGLQLEEGSLEDRGLAGNIPLLLMHGGEDKICSLEGSRRIAQRLGAGKAGKAEDSQEAEESKRTFTYMEWEGLYHEIHNGGPQSRGDEVIREMIRWMNAL